MSGQLWWYLSRASGIIAWLMLTATVLWGIASSADLFARRRRVGWLVDLHRWLGGLTVGFVALHLAALVADSYVHFGLTDLFVPFASDWKPLPVALGVVALWGLIAVQGTSLAIRRLRRRTWHTIHVAGYGVFVLGSFHGITAGTDATQPMYVATTATVCQRPVSAARPSATIGSTTPAIRAAPTLSSPAAIARFRFVGWRRSASTSSRSFQT